jgi:hypothetical protein
MPGQAARLERHSRSSSPIGLSFAVSVGAWRSLVAHLHGVQGVASSNLVAPTNFSNNNLLCDVAVRLGSEAFDAGELLRESY